MTRFQKRATLLLISVILLLVTVTLMAAAALLGPLFNEGANVLILFNNTDEARGTGGFTTAYMTITRHNGAFVTHLGSSYEIDTPPNASGAVLVVPPPKPMQDYMGIDRWSFRDANWSPDAPTSAQAASRFYTQITGAQTPLYVITINMSAAQTLMRYLPSLDIPCQDEAFDAENFSSCAFPVRLMPNTILNWLREGWTEEASGPDGDKSFLAARAETFLTAFRALPLADQVGAIPALHAMLQRGDMLLTSADPSRQAFLAARGWSGPFPLNPTAHNIVYSENNIGYNKVSSRLQRKFTYEVDFTQSPPLAVLTITIINPTSRPDDRLAACDTVDSVGALGIAQPTYQDRMMGCAWLYGQVYPMAGTTLVAYDVPAIPADQFHFGLRGQTGRIDALRDGGAKGWGFVLLVPYGDTRTVTLTSTLPTTAVDTEARLILPVLGERYDEAQIILHRRDGSTLYTSYDLQTQAVLGSYSTP